MRDLHQDNTGDDYEYESDSIVIFPDDDDEDSAVTPAYDAFARNTQPYRPAPKPAPKPVPAPAPKSGTDTTAASAKTTSSAASADAFEYVPPEVVPYTPPRAPTTSAYDEDEDDEPIFVTAFDDDEPLTDDYDENPKPPTPSTPPPREERPAEDDRRASVRADSVDRRSTPRETQSYDQYDEDDSYSDAYDDDSGVSSFSFGRVNAAKKEKEFVFMPFLDISDEPEEDDENKVKLSFSKVKAEKKEKEFVFMPFLNLPEDEELDDTDEDSGRGRFRSSKGTIIDEGLVLMPLESEVEEDAEEHREKREEAKESALEEDTGISIVEGGGAESLSAPKLPPQKKEPKKRPPAGKPTPPKPKKPLDPEQQFREAMRNVSPEILAAVRHDPIQRAALEQAVRIALVQQAAHEAVEKVTGRSLYGSPVSHTAPSGTKSGGKKRPPARESRSNTKAPYNKTGIPSPGISVFDTAPAEFGVESSTPPTIKTTRVKLPASSDQPSDFGRTSGAKSDFSSSSSQNFQQPSVQQDPALAALKNTGSSAAGMPDVNQDPALAALGSSLGSAPTPTSSIQNSSSSSSLSSSSPAAVRAAMRGGLDLAQTQTVTSSFTPSSRARAQETSVNSRSGCLLWIIVFFILFFAGLILIAVWPAVTNEMDYRSAVTALNSGDYSEAAQLFGELDDYRDSIAKETECIYAYGSQLLADSNYAEALEQFNQIKDVSADATEAAALCQYNLGKQYMAAGDYAAAYDQLYSIPKYQDAGDLAMESNYLCAEQYYAAGDYGAALNRYKMYPDYSDSYAKWQLSQYRYASQLADQEKYNDAYDLFIELDSYSDSAYQAALTQYQSMLTGKTYSLDTIVASLRTFRTHVDEQEVINLLSDQLYNPAKLVGTWVLDDSFFSFEVTENGNRLTMDFAGSDAVVYENVRFNGAVVYHGNADSGKIFTINAFTDGNPARPEVIIITRQDNGLSYSMTLN